MGFTWIIYLALALIFVFESQVSSTDVDVGLDGYTLYAPFNMLEVFGNITFHQNGPDDNVTITVNLEIIQPDDPESEPVSETYKWDINVYPVTYGTKDPCNRNNLGKSLHKLGPKHGEIKISPNETTSTFVDEKLKLQGPNTIWGRSILLTNSKRVKYCSTISTLHEVKTARSKFFTPVAGEIILRENQYGDTTIFTNLFIVSENYKQGLYPWQLLVSDVLDIGSVVVNGQGFCDYLTIVYDPDFVDGANCTGKNHEECKVGQLTSKHGGIKIGATNNRYSKGFFVDTHLPIIDIDGNQNTYLVLYENTEDIKRMTCGQIVKTQPKDQVAYFNSDGVNGHIRFTQESPYDPTIVHINLDNLQGRGSGYHIHEFPKPYRIDKNQALCSDDAVGGHFNPFSVDKAKSPPAGFGTNDRYEVGDLSGKFGVLVDDAIDEHYIDFNLALFGSNAIVGRAVVIHNPSGDRWICGNVEYSTEMTTAIATFRYPVLGQVIFRQKKDNPFAETTVFTELSYGDGSKNNTANHRWSINVNRHGEDFTGWQNRCFSAAEEFNTYDVSSGQSYHYCDSTNHLRCKMGDLTMKIGRVNIAARKGSMKNKFMQTDLNLALTGANNIIGRSIVIYDDKAPAHRGNRLACTVVFQEFPIESEVKTWSTSFGDYSKVRGRVSFYQETRNDPTEVKIEVDGLESLAEGYHIHKWAVPDSLEFPCTNDAVSGHFNPFNVTKSPPPGAGSFDQYEIGDLSGKYGTMKEYGSFVFDGLDTSIQLRGSNSILGRSLVIHKAARNFRWVCGNIESDVSIGYPTKVIALASFDQLEGHLRGYIRLTQLVYPVGGASDTTIEVMLRYPGRNNRNVTTNHKWSVFVSQVGADAEIKSEKVRCLAAGFLWNPFLTDTSDEEKYRAECNIYNPLRCKVGDISGRHGPLTVGKGRKVFTDSNLPLYGKESVLARSVVIYSKNGSPNKLGCANLIEERHLVQRFTIRKPQSFSSQQFMDDMRDAIGSFEWLVYAEARSQNFIDEGQCVEVTVHFVGSNAYILSKEFNDLISTGSIRKRTRLGETYKRILYRPCNQDQNSGQHKSMNLFLVILSFVLLKWYI